MSAGRYGLGGDFGYNAETTRIEFPDIPTENEAQQREALACLEAAMSRGCACYELSVTNVDRRWLITRVMIDDLSVCIATENGSGTVHALFLGPVLIEAKK